MVAQLQATVGALDVARYFLWRAKQDNKRISNKKLQKLLYYAQAWHLALVDTPIFIDEIEAWIHGPAVPAVYRAFKHFGYSGINLDISDEEIALVTDRDVLEEVWSIYGKYDAEYLEVLSHSETPWQEAREGLDESDASNMVISHDSMRSFYRGLLNEDDGEE